MALEAQFESQEAQQIKEMHAKLNEEHKEHVKQAHKDLLAKVRNYEEHLRITLHPVCVKTNITYALQPVFFKTTITPYNQVLSMIILHSRSVHHISPDLFSQVAMYSRVLLVFS